MNQVNNAKSKTMSHANPVMKRLGKIDEINYDGKTAAYGRIAGKTAMFLLWAVAGMLIYLFLNANIFANEPTAVSFEYYRFTVAISSSQIGFFIGAGILGIITQLLAMFVIVTAPVTGSIYAACEGFIISFLIFTVLKGYEYLGLLALAITIVVVFTMAMLYATGVIRASKKFHMVLFTLFGAMIGISIVSFIGYLIPVTRPFVSMVMGNFWISIALTLLSIIIATFFLISDFATIEYVVENKMPAKYEWSAAFGLAFTILWIYVRILDLIIQIMGNKD